MADHPTNGLSSVPAVPGALGVHTGAGVGVEGQSQNFIGVSGTSSDPHNAGVMGSNTSGGWGVTGRSPGGVGVSGESVNAVGVSGVTNAAHDAAVLGTNGGGGWGVTGRSATGVGVSGESKSAVGVAGTTGAAHDAAVLGTNTGGGWGVTGRSDNVGVSGESVNECGVSGQSVHGRGVSGTSTNDVGVYGTGKLLAGLFEGGVKIVGELYVQGDVRIPAGGDLLLEGADCAEHFAIAERNAGVEPGTVMVIGDGGLLERSALAYDRRVAGIVSGADSFRPGIILDSGRASGARVPVALIGKVWCKVDASGGPISIGDLLTTSPTAGHAMRAIDPALAFGAVLGKALGPLSEGCGLIPVLVTLQ